MKQEETDSRLWDYIDGLCTTKEADEITLLLDTDPDWKLRYDELLQLHQQLQQAEPAHPSMRFTQNIMEEIAVLPTPARIKVSVNTGFIRGVAAAILLAVVAMVMYSFIKLDWFTTGTASNYLKEFQINKTSVHLIILINIVFLLLFIERLLARFRARSLSKN